MALIHCETAFELSFTKVDETVPPVSAVIVAAGSASRMGGSKQLIPLKGVPVLIRSLQAFDQCPLVRDLVVVARQEEIFKIQTLAEQYEIAKLKAIVQGGLTRQHSVEAGIRACNADTAFYAIHDGARPLVTGRVIEDAIRGALTHGAAAAGVFVKDTIKRVDAQNKILETPDRASLVSVQTPQVFGAEIYRRALELSNEKGWIVTDDCSLCELAGTEVYITPGDYRNLKITTADDIAVAESILDAEGWK